MQYLTLITCLPWHHPHKHRCSLQPLLIAARLITAHRDRSSHKHRTHLHHKRITISKKNGQFTFSIKNNKIRRYFAFFVWVPRNEGNWIEMKILIFKLSTILCLKEKWKLVPTELIIWFSSRSLLNCPAFFGQSSGAEAFSATKRAEAQDPHLFP